MAFRPRIRHLTDADRAYWASFTRTIVPLPGRAMPALAEAAPAPAVPPKPASHPAPAAPVRRATSPHIAIGTHPGGVDSSTWQRFRAGKLAAARKLDLHGLTAQHAFHALTTFLRTAHADRLRCVEVVTGRGSGEGGGVIRREFALWINLPALRPMVLGAVHPHAANPGSVRLLLRRIR